jgi:alpha-glucosidase
MTRLREAYDAINQTLPVAVPPDILIDAMQSGDRLGYHPERAQEEIAHLHQILPQAQAAVNALSQGFAQRLDEIAKSMARNHWGPADLEAQKQSREDAIAKAQKVVMEAGK